jgi:hypothetical protein
MTTDKELQLQVLPDKICSCSRDLMGEQNRDAAKACHALATQGANKQHDPIRETQLWFKHHIYLMSKMRLGADQCRCTGSLNAICALEISNLLGKGLQAAYGVFTGDVATAWTISAKRLFQPSGRQHQKRPVARPQVSRR